MVGDDRSMVQRLCMVIHGHSRPFMVFHCHSIVGTANLWGERDMFFICFPANVEYALQFFPVSDSQTHLFVRIQENHSQWCKRNQRLRTLPPAYQWKAVMPGAGVGWVHVAGCASLPIPSKDQSVTVLRNVSDIRTQESRSRWYTTN